MINCKCEDKRADLLSGGETKRLAQASGQHESCIRGISAYISQWLMIIMEANFFIICELLTMKKLCFRKTWRRARNQRAGKTNKRRWWGGPLARWSSKCCCCGWPSCWGGPPVRWSSRFCCCCPWSWWATSKVLTLWDWTYDFGAVGHPLCVDTMCYAKQSSL